METISYFNSRWWYRLSQVLYVIFCFFLFSIGIGIVVSLYPHVDEYASAYQVQCDDGSLKGNFLASKLDYLKLDFNDDTLKEQTRFACANSKLTTGQAENAYRALRSKLRAEEIRIKYGLKDPTIPLGVKLGLAKYTVEIGRESFEVILPIEKNYEITFLDKEYTAPWWFPIVVSFICLLGMVVIASLIRAIFLFVVFGKNFWKTLFLKI